MTASPNAALRQVISADQIQKRIRELGRQISDDYRGETLIALGILENGFMFIATWCASWKCPSFARSSSRVTRRRRAKRDARNLLQPRVSDHRKTHFAGGRFGPFRRDHEYLMSDLRSRGAASVKLATLLDRQSARRVPLQPDYFGFLVDEVFLCGYGLGSPEQTGETYLIWLRRSKVAPASCRLSWASRPTSPRAKSAYAIGHKVRVAMSVR